VGKSMGGGEFLPVSPPCVCHCVIEGLVWHQIGIPNERGVITVFYIRIMCFRLFERDNNGWRRFRRLLDCLILDLVC